MEDAGSAPLAPGEQPRGLSLPAPAGRALKWAAIAWAVLIPALWMLSGLSGHGFASPLKLLRHTLELALPGLLLLVMPAVVFPLLARLRGSAAMGLLLGLMLGAFAQIGLAVIWLGVGLISAFDGQDPWENLPWVSPPYLDDFKQRHPHLRVTKLNGTRQVYLRGAGLFMELDGNELVGSEVSLAPCGPAPSTAELGGLVPYPGSRCAVRLIVTRGSQRHQTYQFEADTSTTPDALRQHFESWAEALGATSHFSGGPSYSFEAQRAGQRWAVWIKRERGIVTRLYIAQGGYPQAWQDRDTAEPADQAASR